MKFSIKDFTLRFGHFLNKSLKENFSFRGVCNLRVPHKPRDLVESGEYVIETYFYLNKRCVEWIQ